LGELRGWIDCIYYSGHYKFFGDYQRRRSYCGSRARFTLDAMPGKQMAIDADLNAGLIGEDEARKRRVSFLKKLIFMAQWMVPVSL